MATDNTCGSWNTHVAFCSDSSSLGPQPANPGYTYKDFRMTQAYVPCPSPCMLQHTHHFLDGDAHPPV